MDKKPDPGRESKNSAGPKPAETTLKFYFDDEMSDDWLRARRLKRKALKGDQAAQAELDRMESTKLTVIEENEKMDKESSMRDVEREIVKKILESKGAVDLSASEFPKGLVEQVFYDLCERGYVEGTLKNTRVRLGMQRRLRTLYNQLSIPKKTRKIKVD